MVKKKYPFLKQNKIADFLCKNNYFSYMSKHAIYSSTLFLFLNTRGGAYQNESTVCMCMYIYVCVYGGGGVTFTRGFVDT